MPNVICLMHTENYSWPAGHPHRTLAAQQIPRDGASHLRVRTVLPQPVPPHCCWMVVFSSGRKATWKTS